MLARPLIREILREIDITIDEYNKILDEIKLNYRVLEAAINEKDIGDFCQGTKYSPPCIFRISEIA